MTTNQIRAREEKETERANRVKESHKEKEIGQKARELDLKSKELSQDLGLGIGGTVTKLIAPIASAFIKRGVNDKSWYNRDPQLVKDVGRLNFLMPYGKSFEKYRYVKGTGGSAGKVMEHDPESDTKGMFRGIATINYIPTFGDSDSIQLAGKQIKAHLRKFGSGYNSQYDGNDVVVFMGAADAILVGMAFVKRILTTGATVNAKSKYYTERLLQAIGYYPGPTSSNLSIAQAFANEHAALINAFNLTRVRVNALGIPRIFPFMDRHVWLTENIFSDDLRAHQLFAFIPSVGYKYNQTDAGLDGEGLNYGDGVMAVLNQINSWIDLIIEDDDFSTLKGDILKAYGNTLYEVPALELTDTIVPLYSKEILSEVQGATLVGEIDRYSVNLRQDGATSHVLHYGFTQAPAEDNPNSQGAYHHDHNAIWTKNLSRFEGNTSVLPLNDLNPEEYLVNIDIDEPSGDDVMVATRLTCAYLSYNGSLPQVGSTNFCGAFRKIVSFGTEICEYIRFWDMETYSLRMFDGICAGMELIPGTNFQTLLQEVAYARSCFEWCPRIRIGTRVSNNNAYFSMGFDAVTDIHVGYLPKTQLKMLHEVANLSLWNIPAKQ